MLICMFLFQATSQNSTLNETKLLDIAEKHLELSISQNTNTHLYPRSCSNQKVVTVKSSDWTSGFFPGCLWYMYEYTNKPSWKIHAEKWTAGLESEKNNTKTHDLGFMLFNSFGNGYRLTKSDQYKAILLEGAKSLASRYSSTVGCIRSWDNDDYKFPVIIDNMMNLELLFWASKVSGDKSFYQIADSHARTTLKNHFRKNGSSYHMVDYNPESGKVISKTTAQGYANESAWARGQAWGLYGFTMTYRETRDTVFLNQAQKIANYFIRFLPRNKIPYWDFDAPNIPFEIQDASAAAIAASALLELSTYSKEYGEKYFKTSEEILTTLSSPSFLTQEGADCNFILTHSVGNKPGNKDINVSLIYADYYFIEALIRYNSIKKKQDQNK